MRKIDGQPQLYTTRFHELGRLGPCVERCLKVPAHHLFANTIPDNADYDVIFDDGHGIYFDTRGPSVFSCMIEFIMPTKNFTFAALADLSRCLDDIVCVDFSESMSNMRYVAFDGDTIVDPIKVVEDEDENEDPIARSKPIQRMIENRSPTS